jgi:transposase
MKNLPKEQVDALGEAYKKAKNGREKERLHALWLLAKDYTRKQVQEILGVSSQSLDNWVRMYRKDGLKGIKERGQPGNHHKLTKQQKQTIKALITQKTPGDLGLEGRFWTTTQLARLVKKEFAVTYRSVTSYYHLFTFCGFTYHKPDRVNKRQTLASKKVFEEQLKKEWRSIAKELGLSS